MNTLLLTYYFKELFRELYTAFFKAGTKIKIISLNQ